jgi:hypothetical protein
MKRRFLNLIVFCLLAAIALNSCLKENPINVDDGIYIKGKSTAFNNYDINGLMKPAINEVTGKSREGLYEIFVAVSSESEGFNIIEVINNSETIYGPSSNDIIVLTGENGQISGTIQKGLIGSDAGVFTVPENSIYHIIIDLQTGIFVISPVSEISLYRHAIGEDWSEIEIPMSNNFSKSNMLFEIKGLDLTEGEFRFRYGYGDKIENISNEVTVNTCFGGVISGSMPGFELSMIPGGNNYIIDKEKEGTYTLVVIWTVGEGFTAQLTETSSSDYPEKLFMIGDGISTYSGEDAWNWDLNDFEMIRVSSLPHLFWKIVWLNNIGRIRFARKKDWDSDFGKEGEEVNGLYNLGGQDITIPGTAGYFMVVVNMFTEQISISKPKVYLIGEVVGSWEIQNTLAMFEVNDGSDEIYLRKLLKTGYIRMYAWHDKGWFNYYWWNTEFNVSSGKIIYFGNGPFTESFLPNDANCEIKLNFSKGEGSIEWVNIPTCPCSK